MHIGAEVYRILDERLAVEHMFEKEWPGLIAATDNLTVRL
jgi:hypothetical protein